MMFVAFNSNTTGVTVERELITLPEHLSSKWDLCCSMFPFCVVFCQPLFASFPFDHCNLYVILITAFGIFKLFLKYWHLVFCNSQLYCPLWHHKKTSYNPIQNEETLTWPQTDRVYSSKWNCQKWDSFQCVLRILIPAIFRSLVFVLSELYLLHVYCFIFLFCKTNVQVVYHVFYLIVYYMIKQSDINFTINIICCALSNI